ncbi:YciI family protein [Actinoplanes sp. NPDC049265]|uniref:YciI family protein n=1 Tax=Actinoplanes sp. NPDC049265 TaxID=3363902 RepID=UPI00371CDC8A
MKYLLIVDYRPGVIDTPMEEWKPEEVQAHMDYYTALNKQLLESGELVGGYALRPPATAKTVTSDGSTPDVITDGVYPEAKEILAGFQVVDVDTEQRALEIARLVSQVPGPGGVPLAQPIVVRQVMHEFAEQ